MAFRMSYREGQYVVGASSPLRLRRRSLTVVDAPYGLSSSQVHAHVAHHYPLHLYWRRLGDIESRARISSHRPGESMGGAQAIVDGRDGRRGYTTTTGILYIVHGVNIHMSSPSVSRYSALSLA